MDNEQKSGVGNEKEGTEDAHVAHLHSRRTLLTGAAAGMGAAAGLGLAAGALGATAIASPTGAARSPLGNGAGRSAPGTGKSAPHADEKIYLDDFEAGSALTVRGSASFSDVVSCARSGVVSIGAGQTSATHTGISLTSVSLVMAILQNHIPGIYVLAAVPSVSGSSFAIVLSRKVPSGMTANVAWFVVN